MSFDFQYVSTSSGRTGVITTPHGMVNTPAFLFCATRGKIKGSDVLTENTEMVLCNAFHLRHKASTIKSLGGIHKFTNFNKPILTDSGGYQIFSMGHGSVSQEIKGSRIRKSYIQNIDKEGIYFRCPLSGTLEFFSAERSMLVQQQLGVDFGVSFDECTPYHCDYDYQVQSLQRSCEWGLRSLAAFTQQTQKLYGVVQGGVYEELRDIGIKFVNDNDFWGLAIGGSLGKTKSQMYTLVKYISERLDRSRPIHLLGIGQVEDILYLAPYVDSFDCVEPTRIARHGVAIVPGRKLFLKKSIYADDGAPIDNDCACNTCSQYSRAYIHHLLKNNENTSLIVIHNMHIMNELMREIRQAIADNCLEYLKNKWRQPSSDVFNF